MHLHYDNHHPDEVSAFEAVYFKRSLQATLQQANIIFTPTEFVKSEIEDMLQKKNGRRPQVICCGEGFGSVEPSSADERRDLVVLTSRFPHKLTRLAVKYMLRWQQKNNHAGTTHWVGSLPDDFNLPALSNWQSHQRLPESEFRALINRARAVIFFSEYEGFGRPPVEAILANVCPVYSDIPATREIMQNSGCAFDNADYDSFENALTRALHISQGELRGWSKKLLARHNWDNVTQTVVSALETYGR
jgi:glycosyltransferase involved in cell wall biosynthesis